MASPTQIEQLNRIRVDALRAGLVAGLTFSSVALQTNDPVKRGLNREQARKTYITLKDKLGEVYLSLEDEEKLTHLIQRLKSELESLGELF